MLFPHKGSYFATSSPGVVSTIFYIDLVGGGGRGGVVQDCNKRAPHQGGKGNAPNRFLRQEPDKDIDSDKPLAC